MSKRYRLKKDLPDCKAGAVFVYNEDYGQYDSKDAFDALWMAKHVENSPDWFELINDRIEVVIFNEGMAGEMVGVRQKRGDLSIPKEKNQLIKQAIERVLNGDDECYFDADRLNAQRDKLQAMEYAFNAARSGISNSQRRSQLLLSMVLYKTFQDYLNSLTQQNKDQ